MFVLRFLGKNARQMPLAAFFCALLLKLKPGFFPKSFNCLLSPLMFK